MTIMSHCLIHQQVRFEVSRENDLGEYPLFIFWFNHIN